MVASAVYWPRMATALSWLDVVSALLDVQGMVAAVLDRRDKSMVASAVCWQRMAAALDMLWVVASAVARQNVEAAVLDRWDRGMASSVGLSRLGEVWLAGYELGGVARIRLWSGSVLTSLRLGDVWLA